MLKKNKKRGGVKRHSRDLVSYGDFRLPPVVPGPEVEDLCNKVDNFYKNYPKQHKKQKASELIEGAFYAARSECRSNLDWMSQAANSLRGVLYPLFSNQISKNNLIKLFRKYVMDKYHCSKIQNKEFIRTFNELDRIYKQLNDLSHHGTELNGFTEKQYLNFSENDFGNLLGDFVSVLGRSFTLQQIYIHTIIDLIVQRKRKTEATKLDLELVLSVNPDARQYFYAKADERWIEWLWDNGFLDAIKQKAENSTSYGYSLPELGYLARIAETAPQKVVGIIEKVPISLETFNPEVVDRFIRICSTLPVDQLMRVAQKILTDQWIPLMGAFNQFGFEYEKMFKTLADAKAYKNLLVLAKAVLTLRTKEEMERTPRHGLTNNPFYFNDLSYTKVFEHLVNVGDGYAEQALAFATKVMAEVIALMNKEDKREGEKVFRVYDKFILYDVDFFDLELGKSDRLSSKDDIRELAAVIKAFVQKLISNQCDKSKDAHDAYEKYIGDFDNPGAKLPDSRAMWRLRLFIMSQCPEVFKDELKKAFFRLFEVERYYNEIISGREYLKALRAGFPLLSDANKREYVKLVVEYFIKKDQEKENEKENWHIEYGSRILSMIVSKLTGDETRLIKEVGFILKPDYEPEPIISQIQVGTVVPRGPNTQEEFDNLPIGDIAKNLRNEWTPEELAKQNTNNDFSNPLNAEGAGELLRKGITTRLQEYIQNASNFFERGVLDQHYTYSYLRGIQETIKNHREVSSKVNWGGVIDLCIAIKESGGKDPFEREKRERDSFDAWLAGWDAVHSALADVLQELLTEKDGFSLLDFSNYRDQILGIISYLLSYPDPSPEDEQIETATSKIIVPGDDDIVSDPFTMAINTVRGRAFQAFVLFVYQDGKQLKDGVKKLYKETLEKENTRAIMFMFGHYLPTVYFRDKNWIRDVLPMIFPQEQAKKALYTAAWEGYLANNLYEEMFFDPKIEEFYKKGLALAEGDYPKQKHFREPDEGIAVHLGLAYLYYKDFGFGHPLFDAFWERDDIEQHASFIGFLGRSFMSGDNTNANELLKKEPERIKRMLDFWDWMLKRERDEGPKPFIEFGYWINLEKAIFEPAWLAERIKKTLKKTKGILEWDYGLAKSIVKLANEAPVETLEIARLYLLEGTVHNEQHQGPHYLDNEWFDAMNILYNDPRTREGTYTLIDDLIRDGGSRFWKFEEIVTVDEKID